MYRSFEKQMLLPSEFLLPFSGELDPKNRWVKLAFMIPWQEVEERYSKNFKPIKNGGGVALSVRTALGALLIQVKYGFSDVETVEAISENLYMQYFVGFPGFVKGLPFDPSLMVHFRKRLGMDVVNEINSLLIRKLQEEKKKSDDDNQKPRGGSGSKGLTDSEANKEISNQGQLILDATCTPADIHYPTDLWLLNESREHLEEYIDILHEELKGVSKKPRDYRNRARKQYLNIDKQKRPGIKKIKKAIGQQLRYVKRNLGHIKNLAEKVGLEKLTKQQYKNLLVIFEIYRQQNKMYKNKVNSIENRIVSIFQPHVRPIVRGKATADVEFGAKVAVSIVNGFVEIETLNWEAFNEGTTLIESIEKYKMNYGFYPEAVFADKIYRNRENLRFCKSYGIRLSGPKLGRPAEGEELKEQLKQEKSDSKIRNAVEGKFGEGKRFYGLGRITAHLKETSESVIALNMLLMNLEKGLRLLLRKIMFNIFFRRNKLLWINLPSN